MARFISLLQRFGFIGESINETEDSTAIDKSHLRDLPADCYYVTERVLLVPFPKPERAHFIAAFLNAQHAQHYMVWNLSERTYDSRLFGNQVLDFVFMGYPNPPLESIFAIFTSIKGWLDTDSKNVAVVHCQLTQARSQMVLACFLSWFSVYAKSPQQALEEVCGITRQSPNILFPSQRRYIGYINSVLMGERVRSR